MDRIENGQVVHYALEIDEVGDVHEVELYRRPATWMDYVRYHTAQHFDIGLLVTAVVLAGFLVYIAWTLQWS